jgi:hypothetical protein|eukprot:COSAG02_NODE_1518_length_12179_cov_6.141060_3_plen_430_part_00
MIRTGLPLHLHLLVTTCIISVGRGGSSQHQQFELAQNFVGQLPTHLRHSAAQLMHAPLPIPGAPAAPRDGLCVSPTKWGGDPTGTVDSSEAVQAALAFCVNRSRHIDGVFPTTARDAGGCTVDLEGGEYLISSTLRIPAYTSNMQIARGSLVANPKSPMWLQGDTPSGDKAPAVDTSGGACITGFPQNRTDQWCQSLRPATGTSPDICREQCCSLPSCNAWQWCPPGAPCYSNIRATDNISCWIDKTGTYNATEQCTSASPTAPNSVGWVGESRPSAPAPPPSAWTGRFMIAVGGDVRCDHPQGSCNEDIGFPQLFLDGSNVADGIQVNSVMGTTIGPTTYLLNFSSYGIQVNGGHEVMITETWLGETNWDFVFNQSQGLVPRATALDIRSNDHYILNTIVFSSLVGLRVGGAANMISGLHVWFPVRSP